MPLVRITLAKGKSSDYLIKVSDSIYAAMRESFVLAEGDKFHIFEQLDGTSFIYDRDYVSAEPRTDDFMIIQILADARRKDEKIATFKTICDKLATSPGVKPQDLTIIFSTDSTLEDFSLGYGVAATDLA